MTVAAYVESAYSSLRRLSKLGSEISVEQPELRESMSRQLVEALRRQLIATNNLRATCENHLAQITDIKNTASRVSSILIFSEYPLLIYIFRLAWPTALNLQFML